MTETYSAALLSYSQNDEQRHILEGFGNFVGTFLDIGACDGKLNSNTLALVERGWSGYLVEPSPRAFLKLQELHGGNKKLSLIHAAVGLAWQLQPFWDGPEALGYATTEFSNRTKWQHLGFERAYMVAVVPLAYILSGIPQIDFLSIDTEGTSVDLFLSLDLQACRPRLICVEHDGRVADCEEHATRWGYRAMTMNAENILYAR